MDNAKVNEILASYVEDLKDRVGAAVRFPVALSIDLSSEPDGDHQARQHALWMSQEALSWGPERLEKKFRWLGFIQGVLWSFGDYSIEEAKGMNKSDTPLKVKDT
jgi:hypothetical protein